MFDPFSPSENTWVTVSFERKIFLLLLSLNLIIFTSRSSLGNPSRSLSLQDRPTVISSADDSIQNTEVDLMDSPEGQVSDAQDRGK